MFALFHLSNTLNSYFSSRHVREIIKCTFKILKMDHKRTLWLEDEFFPLQFEMFPIINRNPITRVQYRKILIFVQIYLYASSRYIEKSVSTTRNLYVILHTNIYFNYYYTRLSMKTFQKAPHMLSVIFTQWIHERDRREAALKRNLLNNSV